MYLPVYCALVGGAPEAYCNHRVCLSVCFSGARFSLQLQQLSNESCNAPTTQHFNTAKLARFLL